MCVSQLPTPLGQFLRVVRARGRQRRWARAIRVALIWASVVNTTSPFHLRCRRGLAKPACVCAKSIEHLSFHNCNLFCKRFEFPGKIIPTVYEIVESCHPVFHAIINIFSLYEGFRKLRKKKQVLRVFFKRSFLNGRKSIKSKPIPSSFVNVSSCLPVVHVRWSLVSRRR